MAKGDHYQANYVNFLNKNPKEMKKVYVSYKRYQQHHPTQEAKIMDPITNAIE